ncbi:MAG: hypothetical protein MUC60_05020 [Oscillatoria sp. Prado101]|nr:hypothetical protein [Oscillatoria sp. Prado101]
MLLQPIARLSLQQEAKGQHQKVRGFPDWLRSSHKRQHAGRCSAAGALEKDCCRESV